MSQLGRREFLIKAVKGVVVTGAGSLAVACSDEKEQGSVRPPNSKPISEEVTLTPRQQQEIIDAAKNERAKINKFIDTNAPVIEYVATAAEKQLDQEERYEKGVGIRRQQNGLSESVAIGQFPDEFPDGENVSAAVFYTVTSEQGGQKIVDSFELHAPGATYTFYPSESLNGRAFARKISGKNGEVKEETGDFNPEMLISSGEYEQAQTDLAQLKRLVYTINTEGKGVVDELVGRLAN